MTTLILLTLALYFIQALLPPTFDYVLPGKLVQGFGARDNPPPATVFGNRSRRALANMTENLANMTENTVLFLPLAILAIVLDRANGLATTGALVFLLARITYVPLYILGVPTIRSGVWTVGVVGLLMMAAALI